jgi:hypothetical protein
MASKTKNKTFMIQGKLELIIGVEITAETLQEALNLSKDFSEKHFVDMNGEYQDGSCHITGVYEI